MNQITQISNNQLSVPPMFGLNTQTAESIGYLLLAIRFAAKSIVKEAVEEVMEEKGYKAMDEDRTLTAKELCERWDITANTLRNWEIDKKIAPLSIKGRKKIYSMRDVLAVEAAGYVKNID